MTTGVNTGGLQRLFEIGAGEMKIGLVVLSAAALVSGTAIAQIPESISACAAIDDDRARLACFDAAVRESTAPALVSEGAPGATAREANEAAEERREPLTEARSARDAEDLHGRGASLAQPRQKRDIVATVSRVSTTARGQHRVYLDNGQVWQEDFASRYFPVEPGDEVVISKRLLGKGYGVALVE